MLTSYSTFIERIESEYKSQRNYYALAYDGNEVIDAVSVDASGVDESATHAQPPPLFTPPPRMVGADNS